MICGCSAVKVKFDTAVSNKVFENVWFAEYEQMRHPHFTKTRERGGYFKPKIKTVDAVKQTNYST